MAETSQQDEDFGTPGEQGRTFPCDTCGADYVFGIGVQKLQCPFCGATRELSLGPDAKFEEQDFHATLEHLKQQHEEQAQDQTHSEVRCDACGADVVFSGPLTSTSCPYCGSPLQRENVHAGGFRIPVDCVLPFQVERTKAQQLLRDWVQSRWFAPNSFKKQGVEGKFNGVYVPFWTYDTMTYNRYTGQRGENYTVTVGTGKNRRTETRTRWYPASGAFQRFFDDVLINAAFGLGSTYVKSLEPWPLKSAMPFTPEVLAGFFARTYELTLEDGFEFARSEVDQRVMAEVRQRIGGDKQRVHEVKTRYDAITYKHLLLPIWMLAYRYQDKSFRIYVNAVTGEVQGERPYSWVKITLTVLAVLTVIGTIAMFARG